MSGWRQLLVLAGPRAWSRAAAQAAWQGSALWLGEPPAGLPGGPAREAHRWLGRELELLVIDAWAGFDVEAFGAAVGALRGGGRLLLLTPPLADWPAWTDPEQARIAVHPWRTEEVSTRFMQRLLRVMAQQGVTVLSPGDDLPPWTPPPPLPAAAGCRTPEQEAAVAALVHLAHGHPHRPLVLTSDRGRGKSAALGIAAAQLLREGWQEIVVSAPRLAAVDALFDHAARQLPGALVERGRLTLGVAELRFVAPDELLRVGTAAQLLLVDEAAAIPTPLLERLLAHHPRVAFATTVHGYEGTGRGFAVRFQRHLDQAVPGWQALRLTTPIRWGADDPLERFTFAALLLAAAPAADAEVAGATAAQCTVERLDRDALLQDEATLAELFGLLVLAHYRTSPLDLRHLLDGPNLTLWAMRWQGRVVATALVAAEGGFDAALAGAIYRGERRPRGHLIPQSLALHSGFEAAARLRGDRVMRIAVHPAVARRGLGSRLLAAIADHAAAAGRDFVGASFGATAELLPFWRRAGFEPLRLGLSREAASGTHSVIVARPLSAAGASLLAAVQARFQAHLPALLAELEEAVDADLAAALLRGDTAPAEGALDEQDRRDIESFVRGWRGYEVCLVPLRRLALRALAEATVPLSSGQRELLLLKVVEGRPWREVVQRCGHSGRAAALAALREVFAALL